MAEKAPLVYISTTPDLIEDRHNVTTACIAMGLRPLTAEGIAAAALVGVDQADLFLGIIGREYGDALESYGLSRVELEYNQATGHGIPCFIFMMEEVD